jgi:ribosome-associated protein
MRDLVVASGVVIPGEELSRTAVRASGPGGQNVNKVASKVELRFAFVASRALSNAAKRRLQVIAAGRLDAEGRIVVTSQVSRNQAHNLEDARQKLARLVARSLVAPKRRIETKPTAASRKRRLAEKRRQATRKQERRGSDASDD